MHDGNRPSVSPPDEIANHGSALAHQIVARSEPSRRERDWVSILDTVAAGTVLGFGFGPRV